MDNLKKLKTLMVALCMVISMLFTGTADIYADSIYSYMGIRFLNSEMTIYLNQADNSQYVAVTYSGSSYNDSAFQKACDKVRSDLVCKSSNPSVVSFITTTNYDPDGNPLYETSGKIKLSPQNSVLTLLGMSEGTATITMKSGILDKTYKFKVIVKNAELSCKDEIFYTNNNYTFGMKGNASGVSYSSSNKSVATINKTTGLVKTKKAGTTIISCTADNGKTYTYKMSVRKSRLNYTKLTTYYYTGFRKGCYTYFPLVASGIDVKSWTSSNTKVCTVENLGRVGRLKMLGTGKTTITCTSKSGKKYTCKVTVVGGKKWGGLSGGYQPTLSTVKKHGYFKDINSVMDYGDVIVSIAEYDHKINLGNGNKRLSIADTEKGMEILQKRYPTSTIKSAGGGDYLCFTSDNGKKIGRIRYTCYYVE